MSKVLISVVQMNIQLAAKEQNIEKCLSYLSKLKSNERQLVVFPECCITGYVIDSYSNAAQLAEPIPGPTTALFTNICRKLNNVWVVYGLLEIEGDDIYNSAVLIGPSGIIGKYRKTHLLYLGVDRFTSKGKEIKCYQTPFGKVGITICYDLRFPEVTRILSLEGAEIIVHLANLLEGAEAYSDFINKTRACENRVYVISSNRIGIEKGVQFLGKSQIIDITGDVLNEADKSSETIIQTIIDPLWAQQKHVVNVPGEYEFDILKDRRRDLYNRYFL